jgi:hypothetical protein
MSDELYIDTDLTFKLFSDEEFQKVVDYSITEMNRDADPDILIGVFEAHGFKELGTEIGLFIEHKNHLVTNQHNELYKLINSPNSRQLLRDPKAIGLLMVHIRRLYIECLTPETLEKSTGFETETIESKLEKLKKLKAIRNTITLEDSEYDFTVTETEITIPMDYLETTMQALTEQEVTTLQQNSEKTTIEPGTTGTVVNKDNEFVKNFAKLGLVTNSQIVHETID